MVSNMQEYTYDDQYKQEIILIKANGNDKEALRIRYEQYHTLEQDLLYYIKHKSLELLGRKAALEYMSTIIK